MRKILMWFKKPLMLIGLWIGLVLVPKLCLAEEEFPINQELYYEIRVSCFFGLVRGPIGKGYFCLKDSVDQNGETIFHAVAYGGVVEEWFKLIDRYEYLESFFKEDLTPVLFSRSSREDGDSVYVVFFYEPDSVKIVEKKYHKGELSGNAVRKIKRTSVTKDALAWFYDIFRKDHQPGSLYYLPSHDRLDSLTIVVIVEREEEVKVSGKKYQANRLIVHPQGAEIFGHVGDIILWQEKERHLPVLMIAQIPIRLWSLELVITASVELKEANPIRP